MKKIFYLIFIVGAFLVSVTSCEVDNYPYPDAQVYGGIRDTLGGALVETDMNNGSMIGVRELGQYAANPTRKTWYIMQNGEYRKNLVYSNEYRFDFTSCNFFPITRTYTVKPGENKIDFTVTPYIRLKDVSITHDAGVNKIIAKFKLEAGAANVKVGSIGLYAWTDIYVGDQVKKTLAPGTGQPTRTLSGAAQTIDPNLEYTLSIDLAANAGTDRNGFGIHRNYYFRVGAKATGLINVGTIRSNYAPYVLIAL
jgi:hypothetical protein